MAQAVALLHDFGMDHPLVADAVFDRLISLGEEHDRSSSDGGALAERRELTTAFARAGGFAGVAKIMQHREREEALQAAGCMGIATFAEGELVCQAAADAGIFAVLAAALKTHSTDIHVLRWGSIAVLRLTQGSAVRAHQAVSEGVEQALRGPPGGGVWSKVLPGPVASKVDLARRWLALHMSLLSGAAKERRLESGIKTVGGPPASGGSADARPAAPAPADCAGIPADLAGAPVAASHAESMVSVA